MKRKMYRQGDVLIIEVSEALKENPVKRDKGAVVLAYGEVTGHSHQIKHPGATLFAVNENLRILELQEAAELVHEEHAPIKLPAGNFQVIIQRENTALGWRTVTD